jgi:hypothetical protein
MEQCNNYHRDETSSVIGMKLGKHFLREETRQALLRGCNKVIIVTGMKQGKYYHKDKTTQVLPYG